MANSSRRIINRDGKMFIPMNVEGGTWDENFMTSTKIVIIIILIVGNFGIGVWINSLLTGWVLKAILAIVLIYIDQLVIRLFIFEERYYYKMYNKMKEHSITTPAIFWDIASIKETDDGDILTYSDMKVGVIVKLERDTITGKLEDFRETHFDALSDFYKEINLKKYSFVQLNIMEQAGRDPRLQRLDELVTRADNKNVAYLVELQVGHIKNITRATLFESDYFLIYTYEMSKADTIITDVVECIYKLLDGAFIGYSILKSKEILDLNKELYGVKYFDYTDAIMNIFKNSGINIGKSFDIREIYFNTGEHQKIGDVEINRLNILASYIIKNDLKYGEWTIQEALKGKIRGSIGNKNNGNNQDNNESINVNTNNAEYVDLDNYAFGIDTSNSEVQKIKRKNEKSKRNEVSSGNKIKNSSSKKEVDINKGIQLNEKIEINSNDNVDRENDFIDF